MKLRQAAFTLIELMIVVALIGTVLVTTPALMQWLRQQGVSHAVTQLRTDLQLARLMAINQKQTCSIVFNAPQPNQYTNSLNKRICRLSSYRGGVHFISHGPDGNPMSQRISFSRRGMAVLSADVYLADGQNLSNYRILVLAPGGISVSRWNGERWQ